MGRWSAGNISICSGNTISRKNDCKTPWASSPRNSRPKRASKTEDALGQFAHDINALAKILCNFSSFCWVTPKALEDSGIEIRNVTPEPSATVPKGQVISQNPEGGSVGNFPVAEQTLLGIDSVRPEIPFLRIFRFKFDVKSPFHLIVLLHILTRLANSSAAL
ncbi:MAG: PASTA domain-containing protein [Nitrospira sp.]|nr:PASTA domain-containing protein [Nitrospira sp.]